MKLALNTDYLTSTGDPVPRLRAIADAGFNSLHWCHQWCTDFFYTAPELRAVKAAMRQYGLTLLDIHGSAGMEKCWFDTDETRRQAGVLLVRNRIEMFAELEGTGSLMMHIPVIKENTPEKELPLIRKQFDQLKKSIDDLTPALEANHVPLAVENMPSDTFELIGELMKQYPEHIMGITYDSGHGNIAEGKGLDRLEPWKHRLLALHLHDNDGTGDQHQPPFFGKIDWTRLAALLDSSSYHRELSFEVSMRNTPFFEPELKTDQKPSNITAFLADTHDRCVRLAQMTQNFK